MKKTISIILAAVMLMCTVPFSVFGEMPKPAGGAFDGIDGVADISYSHSGSYTGEDGAEFVADGESTIKSNSAGMNSSTVTVTLAFSEAVTDSLLTFDYKISSERNYDYFSINGSTEKKLSGTIDWTPYSINVSAGSVVTLSYIKDSSQAAGEDCIWLRNFSISALGTVTFNNLDASAQLVVKNELGEIAVPSAGSNVYALTEGEYSYTVSKFGFRTITGSFTVSGDMQIDLEPLEQLECCSVRINAVPDNAEVVVSHPVGGVMTAVDGIFNLPIGEIYSYSVSAANYITAVGSFAAAEDMEISVTLVYAGEAWDGTTVTEPQMDGEVYLISNAAELEWFAVYVGAGNVEANARLVSNINFNGKARTAFGEYDYQDNSSGYNGTFDGAGFTVTGVVGEAGLIDCLGPNGNVKNVVIEVEISNSANIGGIANTSKGTIENCMVSGSVSTSSNYCSSAGIVGRAMTGNIVRGCVNTANISNTTNSFASNLGLGGIVGYTYGRVENCYNTGSINANPEKTTNKGIGGIAGIAHASAEIVNVYNVGSVVGPAEGTGAIIGTYKGSMTNAYFLEGCAVNGIAVVESGSTTPTYAVKTAEEMRSPEFKAELGDAFNIDSDGINGGFPILSWQGGSSEQPNEMELALMHYPEYIRDFVNKTETVDMNALTADIQFPTPATLVEAGIMTDRPNQKVIMESMDPDALFIYGYHGIVYRALPGAEAITVRYRVAIQDRNTEQILAERTFELTICPMDQAEIDAAAEIMNNACTEEVYWNGIKGENEDMQNVTNDLTPFSELIVNDNGEFEYIRGAINITFGGIDVDDLPGYDPMSYQTWREFRSSRPAIIANENLLVTRPEYDTEVTIDSVLSYTEFAKYWEKYADDPAYAQFEQFYKQPVSVTVIVKGTSGSGPVEDVNAAVRINGRGFNGFVDPSNEYAFLGTGDSEWTVWDAVQACLNANGFTYTGDGYQLVSVSDVGGHMLLAGEYGENSGWYFRLNGEIGQCSMGMQVLSDGDEIEIFFTDDIEAEGVTTMIGDVDGDGAVTAADALMLLRCAMNLAPITARVAANGDCNADGMISAIDAVIALRWAMGIAN